MGPVRVKVYGLFPLSRRRYLFQAACGAVCWVALFVVWWMFGPELNERLMKVKQTTWVAIVRSVLVAAPWILVGVAVLKLVEMTIVLRYFAAKEAAGERGRVSAPRDSPQAVDTPRSPAEGVSEGSG